VWSGLGNRFRRQIASIMKENNTTSTVITYFVESTMLLRAPHTIAPSTPAAVQIPNGALVNKCN